MRRRIPPPVAAAIVGGRGPTRFGAPRQVSRIDSSSWRRWLSWPRPALALAAVAVFLVLQAVPLYLMVGARRQKAQLEAQLGEERAPVDRPGIARELQEELRRRPARRRRSGLRRWNGVWRGSRPPAGLRIVDLDPARPASCAGPRNRWSHTGPERVLGHADSLLSSARVALDVGGGSERRRRARTLRTGPPSANHVRSPHSFVAH